MPINDFFRGDTKKIYLELKKKDGSPLDLTGCTIFFTMKLDPEVDDDHADVKKNVTNHLDAVNGKTQIILEPDDTNNLEPAKYYYDIQLVTSVNEVYTIEKDRVRLLEDITRRRS